MRTKLQDFFSSIASDDYDIICITETWLCEEIDSCDLFDDRYTVYRRDRDSSTSGFKRGGGVLIAVKRCFSTSQVLCLDLNLECIFVKINLKCIHNLILCVIYIPPLTNSDSYIGFFDYFENFPPESNLFICGDFNLPFKKDFVSVGCFDRSLGELSNFMSLYNLKQYNNVLNCNNKYLDLILSNLNMSNILVKHSNRPLVFEDIHHPALSILINIKPLRLSGDRTQILRYDYKNTNFMKLWFLMNSIDWNFLHNFSDINVAVFNFYNAVYSVFNETIPVKKCSNKYPFWYSLSTKKLLKAKMNARRIAIKNNDPIVYREFKSLRSALKISIKNDYLNYMSNLENKLILEPQKFWSYFKKSTTTSKIIYKGKESVDNFEISNMFADYFGSVYIKSSNYLKPTFSSYDPNYCHGGAVGVDKIFHDDIVCAITELKSSLTVGVDQVPSFIIKGCSDSFIYPLLILFNLSINNKCFPDVWKQTKIIPVHKKGSISDCKNYRPIAILSPFSKILESIIYKKIFNQVKRFISPHQHGFMPKKSTATNLLCLTNKVLNAFNNKSQLDVIYTDFSKAFDTLDFGILLNKLLNYGFKDCLIDWFYSYLNNRSLFVYFNNAVSDKFTNTSGVPQGSNLGPLLFTLFVNDLCTVFGKSDFLFFADDLKIMKTVESIADTRILQNDLDSLYQWCILNKLNLNISKCFVMSYFRSSIPLLNNYNINSSNLIRVTEIIDLGITFRYDFDFSAHIDSMISKAYGKLGFIKRKSTNFSNLKTLTVLYCSFVRSKLEYCSIIWNPYFINKNLLIERVQNNFLRFLYFKKFNCSPNYTSSSDLQRLFNIPTLKSRRDISSLLFFYKVIHYMIDCPEILHLIYFSVKCHNLRNYDLFVIPLCRSNYLKNHPIYRFYSLFNLLGNEIDLFSNFNEFKKKCLMILYM